MYNALGMSRTSAELLLLAALLAGAWMVLGRGAQAPGAEALNGDPPRAIESRDPVGQGLSERASRLRALSSTPRAPVPVTRNPFAFSEPPRPATVVGPPGQRHVEVDSEATLAPRPELRLSGVAEDLVAGTVVRTAVISVDGQVLLAKEGDRLLSRYLVVRIAADAVQLKDAERDELFTLAFK